MPGTGFLTLGAAGALAFSQVVREEYPDVPCKLNEVCAKRFITIAKCGVNSNKHNGSKF